MVTEADILFRIKDFKQCSGWVPAEISTNLIHFIHHEYGVVRTTMLQSLNDPSGHRTDVSPAVPPDFGLVPNTTQGDAKELPVHSPCNRSTQ